MLLILPAWSGCSARLPPNHSPCAASSTPPGSSTQRIVPAGVWQAAEPLGEYSLTGACVGPGFEFTDFRMLADEPGAKAALAGARPDLVRLL